MATGTIQLLPEAAILPDGSASNLGPALTRRKGSQTAPPTYFFTLDFDGAGAKEVCYWRFVVPQNYSSGGTLRLLTMSNTTTSGNVKFSAAVSAVTAADTDTPLEHAFSTEATVTTAVNTTEARRLISQTITLNMDSAAAGDAVVIRLFRDSADGSDTSTVDSELVAGSFEYTTS